MNRQDQFDVVWDGSRDRGPYLLTAYDVPHPAPTERAATVKELVRDQLSSTPLTMRELARDLAVDVGRINDIIFTLRQSGEIIVVGERWNERRHQPERVYALASTTAPPVDPTGPDGSQAQKVWAELEHPVSTRQLTDRLNLSMPTVSGILSKAVRAGAVVSAGSDPATGQRLYQRAPEQADVSTMPARGRYQARVPRG